MQAFDARWNATEVNRSATLQSIRDEFRTEKARFEALLAAAEAARADEARNRSLLAERLRNNSRLLEQNLSKASQQAQSCLARLNSTAVNLTRVLMLSDERVKATELNLSSALRDLKRNLSKVIMQSTNDD